MIDLITKTLHAIPHFTFHFERIKPTFTIKLGSDYSQSLAIIGGAVLGLALLLLLTIIITWICQCCSRADTTVKPRRKVRRLSVLLFVLSVFCFFFLGFCLFGNDVINRGVQSSIASLTDVHNHFKTGLTTSVNLLDISRNASTHIKTLEDVVARKSSTPGTNQTLVSEIDTLLTNLTDSIDVVSKRLDTLKSDLSSMSVLERIKSIAAGVEFERWLLLVILLSIMLCVLFAGVISFCRQSKKGAVGFSGVGILIFLICWILFAVALPFSVALADFCTEGGDFLAETVSQPMLKSLAFYSECDARKADTQPPHMGIDSMMEKLKGMQAVKYHLDALMDTAFNKSAEIQKASAVLVDDGASSLLAMGSLLNSFACHVYKDDLTTMKAGICAEAVLGSSILSLCLVLLGLFMFTLLLIVSKSWNLFTRLGNDYVEVDEDDPFFPRTNESNIPVDIYGTHMYNPRTRDRTEPSTGTTTATANGGEADPLWSRNGTAQPAPIGRSPYDDHYGNYQDRYDV